SGTENPVAVDRHLDDVARGLALKLPVHGRRQDFIVPVNIAQRKFDPGEHMAGFLVGHLVGELDEFSVLDGLTHAESEPFVQKMEAPKILTSPCSKPRTSRPSHSPSLLVLRCR